MPESYARGLRNQVGHAEFLHRIQKLRIYAPRGQAATNEFYRRRIAVLTELIYLAKGCLARDPRSRPQNHRMPYENHLFRAIVLP